MGLAGIQPQPKGEKNGELVAQRGDKTTERQGRLSLPQLRRAERSEAMWQSAFPKLRGGLKPTKQSKLMAQRCDKAQ